MCRSSRKKEAFTLVELLVVAAIFGVMVTVIVSCLVAGVRTWDYARKYSGAEGLAMINLESVHRDIANTFRFYAIVFSGGPKEFSFPGLVDSGVDGGDKGRIGTIKYYFNAEKQAVYRKTWAYPGSEPADDSAEKIFAAVNDMTMNYYALPSSNNSVAVWQESWSNITNIPGAVVVDLSIDVDNKQSLKIRRTVMIPASAAPAPEQMQQSNPVAAARQNDYASPKK